MQVLSQPLQELEDLRLNHDVQRGHGLVRNDELRVAGKGHRDHHALSHPAGELVRVVPHPLPVDSDQLEELPNALHRLRLLDLFVEDDRFRDLIADVPDRVQRIHRTLEDDRNVLPPDPLDRALGELDEVPPVESDLATHDLPVVRQESHDGESRRRLAATALPRKAEGFPFANIERHALDRVDRAGLRRVFDREVLDLQAGQPNASAVGGSGFRRGRTRTGKSRTRGRRCRARGR